MSTEGVEDGKEEVTPRGGDVCQAFVGVVREPCFCLLVNVRSGPAWSHWAMVSEGPGLRRVLAERAHA